MLVLCCFVDLHYVFLIGFNPDLPRINLNSPPLDNTIVSTRRGLPLNGSAPRCSILILLDRGSSGGRTYILEGGCERLTSGAAPQKESWAEIGCSLVCVAPYIKLVY